MRHLRLIWVLAGRSVRELSRMPGVLAVCFVPGIVLYAIFTLVFSGATDSSGKPPQIDVALADLDQTGASKRLTNAMRRISLTPTTTDSDGNPLDEDGVRQLVKRRRVSAGLVIPEGYGRHPMAADPQHAGVKMIVDDTNPMEGQIVEGLMQLAAGRALFASTLGTDDPDDTSNGPQDKEQEPAGGGMLLTVHATGVSAEKQQGPGQVSSSLIWLAGLVPMFLLFSCSGAAEGMLEELASGATRRVLAAPVSPGHLLVGHMIFSMGLCLVQCIAMYLFAWAVFGAPIWPIAGGLLVLTVATASATVGFGMLLASVVRHSQQLQTIGMVAILAMSALGGSMLPRMFMPGWMKNLGLLTINGWAYDGFLDLARGDGLQAAALEVAVLFAIGAVLVGVGTFFLRVRLRAGTVV